MKMFKKKLRRIYLDYAAATPVRKEVKKVMNRFWDIDFGNAGAIHKEGTVAKKAISQSRKKIAEIIKAKPDEMIFNSGGTEANNLAIFGVLNKLNEDACLLDRQGVKFQDMHLITTVFEHPSILQCFKYLEKKGAVIDYLNINQEGIIDLKQLKKVLTTKTVLISIMFVNNEIGTIQPIFKISKIIKNFKKKQAQLTTCLPAGRFPVFHSDAAQALLFLPIDVQKLNVDMMSFDAQKIYGPKGVGALYIKKGVEINPLIKGGNQEKGLRPGTENVPLIVGFAKALELASREKEDENQRLTKLRNYFIEEILKKIPRTEINGSLENRLPNNINIFFPDVNNEFLVIQLDEKGIACSTKSSCSDERFSYVINSLNGDKNRAKSSVRFTLGKSTTKKDIKKVIKNLLDIYG